MEKIARSIADYHANHSEGIAERNLLAGQSPQALFVTCSDSRMVPGGIAAADPGDLFVVRNVGNLIPAADPAARETHSASTGAAIEYALEALGVQNIVIMGHRDCGAMKAVAKDAPTGLPLLDSWLENARPSWRRYLVSRAAGTANPDVPVHDALSMLNVVVQLEHLASYPSVASRIADGSVRLHGWWFDLGSGRVWAYDGQKGEFGEFEHVNAGLLTAAA